MEYDFDLNEYTSWSRKNSGKFPKDWKKQYNKLLNCFYDINDNEKIVTYDEQYFMVIDKNANMDEIKNAKLFQPQKLSIQDSYDSMECDDHIKSKNNIKENSAIRVSNTFKVNILSVCRNLNLN